MITFYTYVTANGRKVAILLEELGLRYRVHKVDLRAGDQKTADFLAVSPMGQIPAVIEELPGGKVRRLFGSGAIMMHFAHRTRQFLPADEDRRTEALSWFNVAITDLSPSAGWSFKLGRLLDPPAPDAVALCTTATEHCLSVLDRRLEGIDFLAEEYSIADMACYPFVDLLMTRKPELNETLTALARWRQRLANRPAVQRGMAIPD